jgi:hypothetical protein
MKRMETSSVGLRRIATSVIGIAMAVAVSGAIAIANQPSAAANGAELVTIRHKGMTRYVVSFYSIGEGIDGKVKDEFVKFLESYPKKIAYTLAHWGREGEIDYCLGLNELSTTEQTEFIRKAAAILSKSKLVHTQENAKCNHTHSPTSSLTPTIEGSYRLVVECYGIGEGLDGEANDECVKRPKSSATRLSHAL